jgi:hypothetical protein
VKRVCLRVKKENLVWVGVIIFINLQSYINRLNCRILPAFIKIKNSLQMSTTAEQPRRQMNDQSGGKKKLFHPFKNPEEKPGGLPKLKYGKGNNYFKFKQALAEMAIKEYGNLGKLIDLEKYNIPNLELPDYAAMGIDSSQVKVMETEAIKGLAKEIDKMRADRPRLYGFIRQHMSVESRDEVAQQPDYADWHAEKDPEKLWQAIVKTHKVDSASHGTEVMELIARKA